MDKNCSQFDSTNNTQTGTNIGVNVEENTHNSKNDKHEEDNIHVVDPIKEFLTYTTAHGMGRLGAASGTWKIIWILFLIGTYAGFSVHLSLLVTRFLSKPLLTVIDPLFPYSFPDVYICPKNAISISRLVNKLSETESENLRLNVELSRHKIVSLITKSHNNNSIEEEITTLLNFDIWSPNVTFNSKFTEISKILHKIELELMSVLMQQRNTSVDYSLHCFNISDRGKYSYKGNLSTTLNGQRCKVWPAYQINSNYNIERGSNYCRNPDNDVAPWCYTTNPSFYWDYCTVPVCPESITSDYCYKKEDYGKYSYTGTQNRTMSRRSCQSWDSQAPNKHNFTVTNGLNYCRNPNGDKTGPWCFLQYPSNNESIQSCGIPECFTTTDFGCYRKEYNGQYDYEATLATSSSGSQCQDWRENSPRTNKYLHLASQYPHNYCRNPGGEKQHLWCYTMSTIYANKFSQDKCNVPQCKDEHIQMITSAVNDYIGDLLLYMFGNDLYFNMVECSMGGIKCDASDFVSLVHPSLGICHWFNNSRFIANKNFKQIALMKLKLKLFADATDIKGQKYEIPRVVTLDMSMYPRLTTDTEKSVGYHLYVLPKGEYPHYLTGNSEMRRNIESGLHTTVKLILDQDETFPDGNCLEPEKVKTIKYKMKFWNQHVNDTHRNTSIPEIIQNYSIPGNDSSLNWKQKLLFINATFYNEFNSADADLFNFLMYEFIETEYDCINNILINTFLKKCNCVPGFLPIPENVTDKYPLCFFGEFDFLNRSNCYITQLKNVSLLVEDAANVCPKRCNIPKYRIVTNSVPWPANNLQEIRTALRDVSFQYDYPYTFNRWRGLSGLFYAYFLSQHLLYQKENIVPENVSINEYLELNRMYQGITTNLAMITIEARSLYGDRVYREEAYPIKNLMADFGGLLGLWSGISVLTICEIIELVSFIILILHRKRLLQKQNKIRAAN